MLRDAASTEFPGRIVRKNASCRIASLYGVVLSGLIWQAVIEKPTYHKPNAGASQRQTLTPIFGSPYLYMS